MKCRWFVPLLVVLLPAPPLLGEAVYRLPQVANGAGAIRTTFVFVNTTNLDTEVALHMTKGDGTPMDFAIPGLQAGSPKRFQLPAGRTRFFTSDGRGDLLVGAARIESTVAIGVFAIFGLLGPGGQATVEAGVGDSAPQGTLTIPVDRTSGFDTGVALFNDNPDPAVVSFAFHGEDGIEVQAPQSPQLPARGQVAKYVGELFPGLGARRGQMAVRSDRPLAAVSLRQGTTTLTTLPVLAGVFDPAGTAGDLYGVAPIVGNLRYVPAGTFTQGSPSGEPCREDFRSYPGSEAQFTHTLTRSLAVMETKVTRQMWADLRAARPTLPADPTHLFHAAGMSNPVQNLTWYEAVLFANLLSLQQGLTRVYYADAALTQPLTASNFERDDVFVNWGANGYRLPTEGEWEYFARAGTTGPFSVHEPNYSAATCESCVAGLLPQLESAAWFCANAGEETRPVGQKASNPWGLEDAHGNVGEWVWDWESRYPAGAQTNYTGPAGGMSRVMRGYIWPPDARNLRSASRHWHSPSYRFPAWGFRLVRTVN